MCQHMLLLLKGQTEFFSCFHSVHHRSRNADHISAPMITKKQGKETINTTQPNQNAQPDYEAEPVFGLPPEKPIFTLAANIVESQQTYLNELRALHGDKITCRRLGSANAEDTHGIIDISTFLPTGTLYKALFISMYGGKRLSPSFRL